MKIRLATQADDQALIVIGHKFFEHNPYRVASTLDEASLLATFEDLRARHVLLVVEIDDKVVGTAAAFISPLYWNKNDLQGLEAFWWVDEEYRSTGAGKALRVALQNVARVRGVKFWNMVALEDSMPEKVGAMYEKAGLKPVERVYMKVIN